MPSVNTAINLFSSTGNSNYNSLQVRVEKRVSHGLSFLTAYTWSHALGEASNANLGGQNNDGFRWTAHPEWEYANLDLDVRQRFLFGYTYDLPFGHGKHFLSGVGGAANQLLGGWQVAGITTLSTGNWFTVTDSNRNFANSDGFGGQRPDEVGAPNGKPCVAGTFFNTCAFQNPPLGSFGNTGQNTLRGPGYQVWDASLFKNFQISERTRLEFRAEFLQLPEPRQPATCEVGTAEWNQHDLSRYAAVRLPAGGSRPAPDSIRTEAVLLIQYIVLRRALGRYSPQGIYAVEWRVP